ncbi:MAG: GNAT family N-acetyltransferase [Flavobacteriales bacterium]|nr:GNAT family N-acetyltransferase [Flavobacteriales bacterium]
MKLFFIPIRENHLDNVLLLFKETAEKINRKKVDHWQYWLNPPEEKINWVKQGIQNEEFFFIKGAQNEDIGMVRILDEDILYWGHQPDASKYVHSLVIREEFNGKGLGRKVLEEIEHLARLDHCTYLRLDSDSKNPKLCIYYESLGFKKVGVSKQSLSEYNLYQKEV